MGDKDNFTGISFKWIVNSNFSTARTAAVQKCCLQSRSKQSSHFYWSLDVLTASDRDFHLSPPALPTWIFTNQKEVSEELNKMRFPLLVRENQRGFLQKKISYSSNRLVVRVFLLVLLSELLPFVWKIKTNRNQIHLFDHQAYKAQNLNKKKIKES